MLPSMPILFTRESQDAFGNKIEPSTSFFGQTIGAKPIIKPVPFPPETEVPRYSKVGLKESKSKADSKKKEIEEEPPTKLDESAQVSALVAAYFSKVQSRCSSNARVSNNKFVQFKDILKTFDPAKESPVDLYKKIELLFGEDQKELAQEFLMFLTLDQAAQVGQFMGRYMLIQLTGFIELLQSTFARKPTMLRKVLRAITNSLNCGSVKEMRAKVLPHLRCNPRLTVMFKALFPDERPPDSCYETGVDLMQESILTEDRGYDVWGLEDEPDDKKRNLDPKAHLDTVYLQGRVFLQHGRNLRPARVTFPYSKEPYRVHARRLAPSHCRLSSPDSAEEESSPRRNPKNMKNQPKRPRKTQTKAPKNLKDVNDNTKHTHLNVDSSKVNKKNQNNKRNQTKKDDILKREKKEKLDSNHKKDEGNKAKQAKVEITASVTSEAKKLDAKSNSWTRDEDKTMLEVLKGQAVTDEVFERIKELLPHRSVSDIRERFFQVMTLLQQMAVGEVT